MDLRTIIGRLQNDDLGEVSEATGVPYETLRRIATLKTEDPRVKTVERIAKYYTSKRREPRRLAA
jgi:predicted transcriptional regulator